MKTKPTEIGFYWVNIPNQYGWEVIEVVKAEHDVCFRCFKNGMIGYQDLPETATEYFGPIKKPISLNESDDEDWSRGEPTFKNSEEDLVLFDEVISSEFVIPNGIKRVNLAHSSIPKKFIIPEGVISLNCYGATLPKDFYVPNSVVKLNLAETRIPKGFVVPASVKKLDLFGASRPEGFEVPETVEEFTL